MAYTPKLPPTLAKKRRVSALPAGSLSFARPVTAVTAVRRQQGGPFEKPGGQARLQPLPRPVRSRRQIPTCYSCRRSDWWQRAGGRWNCAICHPPADPSFVTHRLQQPRTRNGDDARDER